MDEYVSRELLKNRFAKRLVWLKKDIHDEYSLGLHDGCEYDTKLIDEIPAADVAPVVRCKDCKQGEVDDPDFPDEYYCRAGCGWNNGDFYCAYGERKEGAD